MLGVVLAEEFALLHSLDGGASWSSAGTLEGSMRAGSMRLERHALTTAEQAKLEALITADAFYSIRVGAASTSVRAACWATPAQGEPKEQLFLATTADQKTVISLGLQVHSAGCSGVARQAQASIPAASIPVHVRMQRSGPAPTSLEINLSQAGTLRPPLSVPVGDSSTRKGATNRPLGGMPPSGGSTKHSPEGLDHEEPGTPPDDDEKRKLEAEKTWLQKNWLFVMGGIMMVLNVATTLYTKQQGGGGQGAAPAAPAAPARR